MPPRTYAIVGVGALGGFYAGRLHHAGHPVHLLLHSDADHVRAHGLKVISEHHGDLSIPANAAHAYDDPAAMPRCDVVIVGLKTTHNHLLPGILPHVVADGGIVVMLQNGLGEERRVAEIDGVGGRCTILGGLAFLCSHKVGPGHIHHLDYGQVRFGQYTPDGRDAGVTETVRAVAGDFAKAGVPVELEPNLDLARWKKLVWNVPFNGLSVVLNTTTDVIVGHADTRRLSADLMREVQAGAAACGHAIDDAFLDLMMANTDRMVAYKPSMKLDHEACRPLELEAIYGNPIRAAASAGVALPRITMLYQQLKLIDAHRTA
ncbi:MAG: putative 2-dehydropantoate 2-reductase [Phycisphaera sp.]|nr:putative 2-dehydropantoate 2-reductase [Phycisphaera sp.]